MMNNDSGSILVYLKKRFQVKTYYKEHTLEGSFPTNP